MIPTPSSRQDSRHSISFLLSRPESPSFQEAEPTRSTSSLSWASTATATEDAPSPFLSSRSTTIEPPSPAAWDVSTFVPPRPNSGVSTPQTKYLTPPTSRGRSDVCSLSLSTTPLKPAPQHLIKGKARAVLTPLLIGRHEGNSPCHLCLPNSILRSHEPWWALRPENPWDVTYVDYESVLKIYGNFMLQRIEFVPTRPDICAPGVSMLKILQADDAIVDGAKAVNIDSDVVELQYVGKKRCNRVVAILQ